MTWRRCAAQSGVVCPLGRRSAVPRARVPSCRSPLFDSRGNRRHQRPRLVPVCRCSAHGAPV